MALTAQVDTSTAQREAVRAKSIQLSIYLWMSTQLMLQMKKWCNKATCSIKRQKLWSQWPLGAAEREKAVCRSEARTGREAQRRVSDGQRHKAVVLLDVSLEDIWAWAKDTLKPRPVQLNTLQRATCNHCGSPGTIHQQGNFTWKREEPWLRPNQQLWKPFP